MKHKRLLISTGCSIATLSLLLAGCSGITGSGSSVNTDETTATGSDNSGNASETNNNNTNTNTGKTESISATSFETYDEGAGFFKTYSGIVFNLDGEIIDYDIEQTEEEEKEKIKSSGDNVKISNSFAYNGQRFYTGTTTKKELSGDTVKHIIWNSDGNIVFETSDELYEMFSKPPYFLTITYLERGYNFSLYKINDNSSTPLCQISDYVSAATSSLWSDGFFLTENDIYNSSGEKINDDNTHFSHYTDHNFLNGCFLNPGYLDSFELFDENGNLLLDSSTIDTSGALPSSVNILDGQNKDCYIEVRLKNISGSYFVGLIDKNGKWLIEPTEEYYRENDPFYFTTTSGNYFYTKIGDCIYDKDFNIVAKTDSFGFFEDKFVYIDSEDKTIKKLDTNTGEITTLFNIN